MIENPYEEFKSIMSSENLVFENGITKIPVNKKLKDFTNNFEYKLNDFGNRNKFYFEIMDNTTKAVSKIEVVKAPVQEDLRLKFKIVCDNKAAIMNWDRTKLVLENKGKRHIILDEKRNIGNHCDGYWALEITIISSVIKLIDLGVVEIVKKQHQS